MYIEWPVDTASREINWCQTWLGNTQGVRFSQLAFCITRSSADIFTHIALEKYLGARRWPRNNGVRVIYDRVIMESQCTNITNFFLQVMREFKIAQWKRANTLFTNPSIGGEGRVCAIAKWWDLGRNPAFCKRSG